MLQLHNDGTAFYCDQCKVEVPRTRDNPFPEHMCPKLDLRAIEYQYDVRLENLEEDFAVVLAYCRELRAAAKGVLDHRCAKCEAWLTAVLAKAVDK